MCQQRPCGSCYSVLWSDMTSIETPLLQLFAKHFENLIFLMRNFELLGYMVFWPKIKKATYFVAALSIQVCVRANCSLFVYKVVSAHDARRSRLRELAWSLLSPLVLVWSEFDYYVHTYPNEPHQGGKWTRVPFSRTKQGRWENAFKNETTANSANTLRSTSPQTL